LLLLLSSRVGFDLLLCGLLMHGLRRSVAHNQFAFLLGGLLPSGV
jgi:hypothetical protein